MKVMEDTLMAKVGDEILDTKIDHIDVWNGPRTIGNGKEEIGVVVEIGARGNHDLLLVQFPNRKTLRRIDSMDDAQGHCRYKLILQN